MCLHTWRNPAEQGAAYIQNKYALYIEAILSEPRNGKIWTQASKS